MEIVPDTSVIIDGRVSERVRAGTYAGATIVVPEAVVGELEYQANAGRDTGWDGLEELQTLIELEADGEIEVEYVGERAEESEIERAAAGAMDALIRDVAQERGATLFTSDIVQAEVAEAKGIDAEYVEPKGRDTESLQIESFFDEETMSVHLKAGTRPMAKRGAIGEMHYEIIDETVSTEDDLKEWSHDIEETARASPEGFIEIDEIGMKIVQFRDYRIALARPPFADGWEITAVRPIAKTDLADYDHAEELRSRLLERQRGVLVAGSPGAGKSTFAQAVAEFLVENDNAVKTMERPRDLQVGPEITQYTALDGDMAATADSLLMVRPDYTIYDEVRKTEDFEVFADMRLAGVGMIGVVHATRAIDALQRLVGRVELGMIPQVVDTVVFIEAGAVETVYDVTTEVKVPAGLMEEDLARPVIVIRDFETGTPAYEIYTFNRQVVTVPLDGAEASKSGVDQLAEGEIEREIRAAAEGPVEVDVQSPNSAIVYVDTDDISHVIGRDGKRIREIENRLGIDIDVRTFEDQPTTESESKTQGEIVTPEITTQHIIVPVEERGAGETVEVQANGEYLFTATVGRGGEIQVSRGSAIAEELERAIDREEMITVQ
ncbi:PINc/VapC family ATPase [Halodesulfurarchaeum sp. HSR-GB]|uniref:PINc/VapC family ATPase n=1 Tax=Halodesulfurarchaeum sp. HSR-GB TaxID=3074077 RepID=UPI00285F47FF|nr:PINc/VapC family ATPase [Halodesulfurarchaeum sp. HSR-GB]MDR5656625.1 PINc/VapC family ATPase [Halodesulfurarchaeum sp. HSR-GB]